MLKTSPLAAFVLACMLTNISFASSIDILESLDFTGAWDHSQIANGGLTFEDICGDLDVTVTAVGTFDADSTFVDTGQGTAIRSQHATPGSHSLVFTFSEPIEIELDFIRLDLQERLGVFGIGPETYVHSSGTAPIIVPTGSGISLFGQGFGPDAADGSVRTGPTTVLTVSYEALPGADHTKYQSFNLSKVVSVPEPGSLALFGLACLGIFAGSRKRN